MKFPGEIVSSPTKLILTANRRLARRLRLASDQNSVSAGARAWRSPEVMPVEAWLRSVWEASWPTEVALTPFTEELLWAQTVARRPIRGAVLGHWETARHALAAHRLLGTFGLELPEDLGRVGLEVRTFVEWRREYQQLLEQRGWADRESILDRAVESLRDGFRVPEQVTFAGFDEHPPRLERLLSVLADRGVQVHIEEPPNLRGDTVLTRPKSPDDEIARAARWCRGILESEPEASIGVVVPDLHDRAQKVREVFDGELSPGRVGSPDGQGRRFNLSYAPPLSEAPVVQIVLKVLSSWGSDLSVPFLTSLLRSPFLGESESERDARDRTEETLHAVRHYSYEPAEAARVCRGAPRLAARLERWQEIESTATNAAVWSDRFRAVLVALGWPGERSPNSEEQQAVDRLLAALDEFAALDLVTGSLELSEASALFARFVHSVLFQPQLGESSVEILGVLEAAGMVFDHLWVAGFHEEGWPARSAPNPLLPISWQAEHGMPHATAEQDIDHATLLTARVLGASPDVVVSAPLHIDDRELMVSPLVSELPEVEIDPPSADPTEVLGRATASQLLTDFRDAKGPRIAEGVQSGGVRLFADQAACAFRGFGRHRLRARALDPVDDTIHPFDRGNFFHYALELLWGRIDTHAGLYALGDEGRQALVAEVVDTAAKKFIDARTDLPEFYRRIERERARDVLELWLGVELARSPFEVVELEAEHTLECGGVSVRVIIDRVDELAMGPKRGQRVIVDYKTGRSLRKEAWFEERNEEPQLPLYAIGQDSEVAALAFGGLHRDRIGYHGYSEVTDVLPSLKGYDAKDEQPEDWVALFEFWRRTLTTLGASFANGEADVFPKHPRNTCVRCDLHALCRIGDERTYREDDDELFVDEEADE